ncbi:NAD-dependent epimerase/dehydratase family protein [Undibacterium sp. WLX3042]|uniref:NAD-dependent epimerase/dehydratase family protein n=1 Tax=Undibacterium sp. WLX3042 TaxID=3412686 RepID=UPI003C2C7F06
MSVPTAAMHATLIGGHGFIGRHLQAQLRSLGWTIDAPLRNTPLAQQDLGHVFYCAGLTADFRQRPYDTVEAHVTMLSEVLRHSTFSSLTYFSSTRVYAEAPSTTEDTVLQVRSHIPGDLYNLSKLMGESLCLASQREVRVVRLSNVYGAGMQRQNFLAEVLTAAAKDKHVVFRSSPASQKDYIAVQDVVRCLPVIASHGTCGIYNLASGVNVSNAYIAAILQKLGVRCEFLENAPDISFPDINIAKTSALCGAPHHKLAMDLPTLYSHYCEIP